MLDDPSFVSAQYHQTDSLQARIALHQRFSTNPVPWTTWLFDQLPFVASGRLLEVGCGPGDLWADNHQRLPTGWSFVLSDLKPAMVDLARDRLGQKPRFGFLQVDAQAPPFEGARFDLVIANHMLYHVPDLEGALAQLTGVLKPGGWLVAATNGASHMLELSQLMSQTLPGTWFGRNDKATSGKTMSFNLETGGNLIDRYLNDVEVRRHPNDLRVTEVEPLLSYILSLFPGRESIDDQGLTSLIDYLTKHLTREGALHITKDVGIILGRKQ